jgi:hypothetical protein
VESWQKQLKFDPLPQLPSSENEALQYFVRRDLSGEKVESIETLWQLSHVVKMTSKQQEDGSWKYPGGKKHVRSGHNYNQLQTYKVLGQLVEKYGLTRKHSAIRKTAEFLFTCQTEEGDFRGIYQNQYTPNYTAAIMELLIKAGYEEDQRIERGFSWLLFIRQNDGGWTIPFRTIDAKDSGTLLKAMKNPEPIKPDKTKPFSHCITGVVLRAFAAHQKYRKTKEAKVAGALLKSRFFQPDKYPDRRAASFWIKITYPFWFTDILSSLDSLSLLGFPRDDSQIKKALAWLTSKQKENGIWKSSYEKAKDKEIHLWVTLAVCRMFKRFYDAR